LRNRPRMCNFGDTAVASPPRRVYDDFLLRSARVERARFEQDMENMQRMLRLLAHEYDLFFAGNRKEPPFSDHQTLDKMVRHYRNSNMPKLAFQFRFSSFASTYTLHCERWNKWMRAKEQGLADDPRLMQAVQKAKEEERELDKGRVAEQKGKEAEDAAGKKSSAEKPKKNGPTESRRLYDDFINAKLESGQSPEMDFESFEKLLARQRQALLERYEGKKIQFSVVTKDGKVTLKAKVRKQ